MKTIFYHSSTPLEGAEPSVATIGFFDGVHEGHRFLLRQVSEEAHRRGLRAVAITFDRHPREVLRPDEPARLLTPLATKLLLLSKTGIDATVVLPFSREMAALSARDFMADVLKRQLAVETLLIGYDHHFGHNRSEGFHDYVTYGRELGIDVLQSTPLDVEGVRVSSSAIRQFVLDGDIAAANRCLGYRFTLQGTVEHGFAYGRKLGFPTANLRTEAAQVVPCTGVYAVWVRPEGEMRQYRAMMNIGMRPTFNGEQQTMEVNIFQYKGNLYGRQLLVSFAARVRDERRFDSPDALAQQLEKDKQQIEQLLHHEE